MNVSHLNILRELLVSQSVTETSVSFNLSQPSVSRILARMRKEFRDPLLVRSGERMVLTERGMEIRRELSHVLERVERLTAEQEPFEPGLVKREFRFACTDSNMVMFVPAAIARIAAAGRGLRASVRSVDPALDIIDALETGELDAVVDCVSSGAPSRSVDNLHYAWLGEDDVVLMVRKGHALIGRDAISVEEYLELDHLAPYPSSRYELGPIDGVLARLKKPRRIRAYVPEYNLAPYVLAGSDFVFTTCRQYALHYARIMPFEILPGPDIFSAMRFRLLWHEKAHRSPAQKWLRETIMAVAEEIVGTS